MNDRDAWTAAYRATRLEIKRGGNSQAPPTHHIFEEEQSGPKFTRQMQHALSDNAGEIPNMPKPRAKKP